MRSKMPREEVNLDIEGGKQQIAAIEHIRHFVREHPNVPTVPADAGLEAVDLGPVHARAPPGVPANDAGPRKRTFERASYPYTRGGTRTTREAGDVNRQGRVLASPGAWRISLILW